MTSRCHFVPVFPKGITKTCCYTQVYLTRLQNKKNQIEAGAEKDHQESFENENLILLTLEVLGLLFIAKWKFKEDTSIVLMKVTPWKKCNSNKNTWYKIKKK